MGRPDAEDTAGERQHHVLGEELANEPPASRTEGGADNDFTLARNAARQRQVGQIGAANEQHEASGRHQHQEGRAHVLPDDRRGVALDDDAPILVGGWKVLGDARANHVHARLCLCKRDTVLEPRERGEPVEVARHVRGQKRQRPPDLRRRSIESASLGQHANDGVRLAVQLNDTIDDVGIGTELALPQRMADHRDLMLAELILTGQEGPAQGRFDAEDTEVTSRHAGTA